MFDQVLSRIIETMLQNIIFLTYCYLPLRVYKGELFTPLHVYEGIFFSGFTILGKNYPLKYILSGCMIKLSMIK